MAARTPKPRTHPRLAHDGFRGWLPGLILLPLVVVIPIVLVWVEADVERQGLSIATIFIWWTLVCLFTAILHVSTFIRAPADELARWLRETQPPQRSKWVWILVHGGGSTGWAVTGSLIAVLAVLILSFIPSFRSSSVVVFSGIAVVVASLALTITSYAVRYARESAVSGGIVFPGDEPPRFTDFLYLSIQVSTTFSASDVALVRTAARKVVSVHSLIAFAFNTIIVALLVSVLVSVAA